MTRGRFVEGSLEFARTAGRRAWPAPLVVACVYLLLVIPILLRHGALSFVHFGSKFLAGATTSHVISPAFGGSERIGYDGQFYFSVAIDPRHAVDYISAMGTAPGYVYSRIFYPMLARLFGGSSPDGVASALLGINLVAVVGGTFFIAAWLRRRDVNAAYSLIYGLFPGMIFSVFRDLTEPLAYALVAASVYAFDRPGRRAVSTAAVLSALAVLTRETTAVFPALMAASLVVSDWRDRRGLKALRRGSLFLAASVAPLLVWRDVIGHRLASVTQERPGGGTAFLVPFHSYVSSWPWQPIVAFVFVGVVVPTILTAAALTVASVRTRKSGLPMALFVVNALVFVAYVPAPLLIDYGAAARAVTGLVLALALCLPLLRSWPRIPLVLAVIWSPAWFIACHLIVRHVTPPLL